MRRAHWSALALVLLSLTGTGCEVPPAMKQWLPAEAEGDHHVVLFGASLSAMAETPARSLYSQHDGQTWSYNAVAGKTVQYWLPLMGEVGSDDVVVFGEMMINNLHTEAVSTGQLSSSLHAGLDALRSTQCVVFVTLNETSGDLRPHPFEDRTRWVNTEVRKLVADGEYPNLVLVDWAEISRGHTEWLHTDNLHNNAVGNQAYAEMLASAPEMCP